MAAQPVQQYRLDQRLRKRRRSNLEKPNLATKREKGNEQHERLDTLVSGDGRESGLVGSACYNSQVSGKYSCHDSFTQESILRFVTRRRNSQTSGETKPDIFGKESDVGNATSEQQQLVAGENWDFLKEEEEETLGDSLCDDASIRSLLSSPIGESREEEMEDMNEDEPFCSVAPEKRIAFGSSADLLLRQVYDLYGS
ncbi:hypothetical protein GAYE_PCTG44G1113 [Galdieria yellowstonensis]|uniref:Uncharacterized protein n=1 Tax=Galdieria yellowstonensis TaxID=3028027 RepID=A0AAV9I7Z8_9RHOD|nr:hypothetical protein GAYE_PCTG44G1113 [Galdieria yellowstonensis]